MKGKAIFRYIIIQLILFFTWFIGSGVFATVPQEYYPNYQVSDSYETLLELFIEVEAISSVGDAIPSSLFLEMNQIFERVFPYFPQNSTNQIIYRQCELITQELSSWVDRLKYLKFQDRCYNPLWWIIKEINSKFTVKARATWKPTQWSAPLNVTFDARSSEDPSNDTIPSDNFYRYYTDTDGNEQTIGRWPVINYTFRDPWNHIVHLTVRSVNNRSEWIFDGESSLSINVAPKAADIILYVWWKRAISKSSEIVKLWATSDGQWILLDATSTRPTGARTIQEHKRTISNDDWYNYIKEWDWWPWEFTHSFPQNWIYTIQIDIIDNENNRVSEKFKVSISDPVAIIRQNPSVGSTSTEFTFDGATSYAITSRIKTYQRTVTDPNWNQTDRTEWKEFKRKFLIPWMYTIRLTVIDEDGSSSYATRQINVWSTPPIPTFTITPQSELKSPSQYIFDATASFDEDVRTWSDELSYQRLFSNNEQVTIQRAIENDNSIIKVSFEQPWIYKVKLIVEDAFGERETIEKDIDIESTLRPELVISPQVWMWWSPVVFAAKANKSIAFYERDFGDGEKQQSKTPRVEHTYTKAWIYLLKLRVSTTDGEENTLIRQVFMGQKDMPVIWYQVKERGSTLLQPESSCPSGTWSSAAYEVIRYENLQIDASLSRNAQWTKQDLVTTFHPKNDQIYKSSSLTYSFPELWCTEIKLFVEDQNLWKTATETLYFNVVNALPELSNLTITFPQSWWWSPIGVWTDTTQLSQQDLFSDPTIGQVVVRVKAKWARDPDGFISHYRRRYYPSEDPSRKQWFKITPSDVPYATFIVPKPPYATEYAFAVELIDNDDGRVRSEDVIGKWPIVFFPPGEWSLDIPIVTMKTSSTTTRVWEQVTFTVNAQVLSDRPDFVSSRYFKYDFDGDGEYDILSTKQSTVTHTYDKATDPGIPYRPQVAVYYRSRAGKWSTEPITVLRSLKPRFEVNQSWKTILLEDFSLWDVISTVVCVDESKCGDQLDTPNTWSSLIYTQTPFVHTYDTPWRYTIIMQVADEYGNIQVIKQIVTIEENETAPLLSIPWVIPVWSGYELMVSSATNNTVSFYLPWERCYIDPNWNDFNNSFSTYIDLNTEIDSNVDWHSDIDHDIPCNTLITKQLFATQRQQSWVIYQWANEISLTVVFEEFVSTIPQQFEWAEKEIDMLLETFGTATNDTWEYYRTLLKQTKLSLWESDEVNSTLIQLREFIETNPSLLSRELSQRTYDLIENLGWEIVIESFGGSEYAIAKSNILWLLNEPFKQQATELFQQFEQAQDDKVQAKMILDKIYTLTWKARDQWINDTADFFYIESSLCDIIIYNDLPSVLCWTATTDPTTGNNNNDWEDAWREGSSVISTILKRVIGVVVVLVIWIGAMILVFAIKARRRQQQEEQE